MADFMDELQDDDELEEEQTKSTKEEEKPKSLIEKVKEKLATPSMKKIVIIGGIALLIIIALIIILPMCSTSTTEYNPSTYVKNPKAFEIKNISILLDTKPKDEDGRTINGRIFVTTDVNIVYEETNKSFLEELTQRKYQLYDKISYLISIKKPEELNSSSERKKLEQKLKEELNKIITNEGDIKDVNFSQFRLNIIRN